MKTMTHEAASLALVVELPNVAERDALIGYLYSESTDIEENPGVPGRSLERLYRSAAIEFGVRSEICRGIIEGE